MNIKKGPVSCFCDNDFAYMYVEYKNTVIGIDHLFRRGFSELSDNF